MMPFVSVVIPNHNYARFVSQSIDSVLAQTYPNFELIVVDNGSTDSSREVLGRYVSNAKVRVVFQENRGQAGARNRGIDESQGEWIAFCDADDVWMPEKLMRQVALIHGNGSLGLVSCGFSKTNVDLRMISKHEPRMRGWVLDAFVLSAEAVVPAGESCVLISRKAIERVGKFDEALSISSGFDMYRRVCSVSEIDFVPDSLVLYRQHSNNASLSIDRYASDYLRALQKVFDDPLSAAAVAGLQSVAFSKAHLSLAGAYYHHASYRKFMKHLFLAFCSRPTSIGYAATYPIRLLSRKLSRPCAES